MRGPRWEDLERQRVFVRQRLAALAQEQAALREEEVDLTQQLVRGLFTKVFRENDLSKEVTKFLWSFTTSNLRAAGKFCRESVVRHCPPAIDNVTFERRKGAVIEKFDGPICFNRP